jgi:hypothetical protein
VTLPELEHRLAEGGVRLSLRLVVDAPPGVVTPEVRGALVAYRPLLLSRLAREALWAELSRWRWGPAAHDGEGGLTVTQPGDAPTNN